MVLTVGLSSVASAADLLIRTRVTMEGAPRSTELAYYLTTGKKVVDRDRQRTVIDYERRTVTTLDKRDRTYRVTTFEDLKRDVERMPRSCAGDCAGCRTSGVKAWDREASIRERGSRCVRAAARNGSPAISPASSS